ncbi:DNA-binding transcriptional LysR family regulator [Lachnotalea glycerini]|uniref:DNA-binding transcriptional LysR family regulator n=1 Tax=Lachnotalea glycerini TaxID=1763509 RepID=A0A255IAN2_9FIRM|nr:LysR family transcriptional regulator [Lachnotalea glycerini]PXV96150.1 DNA-binding transcriptional LysR family regulator [Lachnotalea glycerini]RDY31274.1 LysR family transcriptional regulator [Lachnotalea glycerini]
MSASFDSYKIFYYVAKYQNITAAAKALFLTQPTVSHCIHGLEAELGCILFLRSQKGVTLTPEGLLLYEHVSIACEHIFKAEDLINAMNSLSDGVIHIGASETTLHHYLLPYLKEFRLKHPKIKLQIANNNTPSTIEFLKSGLMDVAILVMATDEKDTELTVHKLASFRYVAIASDAFMELKGRSVSLRELCDYPLICMEAGTFTRKFLDKYFLDYHYELKPDIELATADLITPMVKNDLGVGFAPYEFARKSLLDHTVFELNITEKMPPCEICAITNNGRPLSIASQAFLQMLLKKE